jgi:tetratricopeptide (TPR) repeat protein
LVKELAVTVLLACGIIAAMSFKPCLFCCVLALISLVAQPPDPAADLLRQGRQKLTEGKQSEALAIYKQAVESFPKSVQANNQTGVLLDLMGQYGEARKYFGKAIEVAATPQAKGQAQRAMAMSYAFEGDCKNAAKYEGPLYEQYLEAKDYFNAGETADEVARVCIDAGNLDDAYAWYRKGHEAGMNEPDPKQKDLWNFRWEHALGRIAARRGKAEEAQMHVAAAKAILDKGTNPQQAPFFPYLAGYVALYAGDYRAALAELQKANQDPFILVLIAQTYERLEDKDQATQYYKKAMGSNAHNPPNAAARRMARSKAGG